MYTSDYHFHFPVPFLSWKCIDYIIFVIAGMG